MKDNQVYVNLFLSNRAELKLNEKKVVLEQETGYPWNGDIRVKVAQGNLPFTMNIRIPGWVRGSVLPSDFIRMPTAEVGLSCIGEWRGGDR